MANKLLFLFREERFVPSSEPLLKVPRPKLWLYLLCQVVGVALLVAISQTIAAIGSPYLPLPSLLIRGFVKLGFNMILVCALIPFRWVLMPKYSDGEELKILDSLTADSEVVLARERGGYR